MVVKYETEPNGSFLTADNILSGQNVFGNLSNLNDDYYYKFYASSNDNGTVSFKEFFKKIILVLNI